MGHKVVAVILLIPTHRHMAMGCLRGLKDNSDIMISKPDKGSNVVMLINGRADKKANDSNI